VSQDVLVIVGAGGMGLAIARRAGSSRLVLLADVNEPALQSAAAGLRRDGHRVEAVPVDVTSQRSVAELADAAGALGPVRYLAHTAGVSPAQAPRQAILDVDMSGAAFSIEEFGRVIAPGGAGVVIASMAAAMLGSLTPEQENQVLRAPAADLASLPFAHSGQFASRAHAYGFAKRVTQLRVRAACASWGRRGARINSVSPGVIATPMGHAELETPAAPMIRAMIDGSPAGRTGTPDDVAGVVEFLLGPSASFITGADLVVDGGVTAALASGEPGYKSYKKGAGTFSGCQRVPVQWITIGRSVRFGLGPESASPTAYVPALLSSTP
jgi:NAD(P)-dependent dehydrogenase (short-subunit alcohol dehydrogenase family)